MNNNVYAQIGRQTLESLAKDRVAKAVAIKELETQAEAWERKALEGTYTLSKEIRDYYENKAKAARREAAILKGEATAEQAQPAKAQSITLPGTWRPQGRR